MTQEATATIHFIDGTKMVLRYPKQAGTDPTTIVSNVRKAIDQDKLLVEVEGSLLIIPSRSIKFILITPKPDALPQGVILGAQLVK